MNILAGTDAGIHVGWHGLEDDTSSVPGQGSVGPGAFALDLDNGYTVSFRWPTDVIKSMSGIETRSSERDDAQEGYAGSALLLGDDPVNVRAALAQYAATGSSFLIGLPHEQLLIQGDSAGSTVPVGASELDMTDWFNPGQRVLVVRENEDDELEAVEAIIQSTGTDTIVLDTDPGDAGLDGGRIMPGRAVFLEPQQSFERYPVEVEEWKIAARAASTDFAIELPSLELGPLTVSAGLAGAVVAMRSLLPQIFFALNGDPLNPADGQLIEGPYGSYPLVLFNYQPGTTTIQQLIDAMAVSTYVNLTGATDPTATLQAGDECGESILNTGAVPPVGRGTSLATYSGNPLWDREIIINGTITDGIHAMTEIIEYGGAPYALGLKDHPDWYRTVAFAGYNREAWQWWKLFMSTVKGCQKAFYLSTWRDDLAIVSHLGADLVVTGNVSAWYPEQRQHLHVREADGTHVHCEITDATDNGDGTWTLITFSGGFTDPIHVSWLELCRFEKPDFQVTFGQHGFFVSTIARVVQQ